jgi:hypothetical protein
VIGQLADRRLDRQQLEAGDVPGESARDRVTISG